MPFFHHGPPCRQCAKGSATTSCQTATIHIQRNNQWDFFTSWNFCFFFLMSLSVGFMDYLWRRKTVSLVLSMCLSTSLESNSATWTPDRKGLSRRPDRFCVYLIILCFCIWRRSIWCTERVDVVCCFCCLSGVLVCCKSNCPSVSNMVVWIYFQFLNKKINVYYSIYIFSI